MPVIYIIEFIFFGIAGWGLDSLYRSISLRRWTRGGYFRLPFSPIYGLGGLALMFIFRYYASLPWPFLILTSTVTLILVEYLGGIFCERVLQIKLWDYSKARFNIGGYIDLEHSVCWLLASFLFYHFIFFRVYALEDMVSIPKYFNLPSLVLVVVVLLWAVIRKNPNRFLEFKEKMLNLSVDEYRQLIRDIRRLQKYKQTHDVNALKEKISEKLKKAGAQLKKRGD